MAVEEYDFSLPSVIICLISGKYRKRRLIAHLSSLSLLAMGYGMLSQMRFTIFPFHYRTCRGHLVSIFSLFVTIAFRLDAVNNGPPRF